jgi:hypothetical protein
MARILRASRFPPFLKRIRDAGEMELKDARAALKSSAWN